MAHSLPLISILITTFNRSTLLKRAINSVLQQDYQNFELIVVDDCSTDDTPDVIVGYNDHRIKHIRHEQNIGSKLGDRAHIRKFVYELMQGEYFVYLCDDDYWSSPTLLSRQIAAFNEFENVAFVMGGQLSYIPCQEDIPGSLVEIEKIPRIEYKDLFTSPLPKDYFIQNLFNNNVFMPSELFLTLFAADPATRQRIVGATLYSKKHFVACGAMNDLKGSQWQAGYELLLGPACCGNVVYFDEPAVIVETKASNASFQRTQVEHYMDSMISIKKAFEVPLKLNALANKKKFLQKIKHQIILKLTHSFLRQTIVIKIHNSLTLNSEENIKKPVKPWHALKIYFLNTIMPTKDDFKYFYFIFLPRKILIKLSNKIRVF